MFGWCWPEDPMKDISPHAGTLPLAKSSFFFLFDEMSVPAMEGHSYCLGPAS